MHVRDDGGANLAAITFEHMLKTGGCLGMGGFAERDFVAVCNELLFMGSWQDGFSDREVILVKLMGG